MDIQRDLLRNPEQRETAYLGYLQQAQLPLNAWRICRHIIQVGEYLTAETGERACLAWVGERKIAVATRLNGGTVHRVLSSLQSRGAVTQGRSGRKSWVALSLDWVIQQAETVTQDAVPRVAFSSPAPRGTSTQPGPSVVDGDCCNGSPNSHTGGPAGFSDGEPEAPEIDPWEWDGGIAAESRVVVEAGVGTDDLPGGGEEVAARSGLGMVEGAARVLSPAQPLLRDACAMPAPCLRDACAVPAPCLPPPSRTEEKEISKSRTVSDALASRDRKAPTGPILDRSGGAAAAQAGRRQGAGMGQRRVNAGLTQGQRAEAVARLKLSPEWLDLQRGDFRDAVGQPAMPSVDKLRACFAATVLQDLWANDRESKVQFLAMVYDCAPARSPVGVIYERMMSSHWWKCSAEGRRFAEEMADGGRRVVHRRNADGDDPIALGGIARELAAQV